MDDQQFKNELEQNVIVRLERLRDILSRKLYPVFLVVSRTNLKESTIRKVKKQTNMNLYTFLTIAGYLETSPNELLLTHSENIKSIASYLNIDESIVNAIYNSTHK